LLLPDQWITFVIIVSALGSLNGTLPRIGADERGSGKSLKHTEEAEEQGKDRVIARDRVIAVIGKAKAYH
jgi:hypothetical protein